MTAAIATILETTSAAEGRPSQNNRTRFGIASNNSYGTVAVVDRIVAVALPSQYGHNPHSESWLKPG